MTTPRFNVFNQIHKGLRALMFDTVSAMQQTDMAKPADAQAVIAQTELLLDTFDSHADHEDTYILALAKQYDATLIDEFESEHHIDLHLTEELRKGVAAYRDALTPAAKIQTGNALYYALNAFVAFNLTHMNKEEQQLNQLLWANFSDEEIMAMEHRIVENISPDNMAIISKWMIKGGNNTELNSWLDAVKASAPDFVYNGLLQACGAFLPTARYAQIIAHQTAECLIG